jgi:hypothetical protein
MRQALKLHPDSSCAAVTRIEVEIARPRAGALLLSYRVTGKIGDLDLPPVVKSARADELWRHTCFEAFIRPGPGEAYYEFNFSPSTEWAVYRFSGYRGGMCVATGIGAPQIELEINPERYALQAVLVLSDTPDWPRAGLWRLGVSAVIEETNGHKSYWALAHPPGRPDFHHSDCFACEI